MKVLERGVPGPKAEKYATHLLHNEASLRVIAFHLSEGQAVAPHSSPVTVMVQVVEGSGTFRGEGGEARLGAGETAVYAPGETHSMSATEGPLRFLAVMAPSPS